MLLLFLKHACMLQPITTCSLKEEHSPPLAALANARPEEKLVSAAITRKIAVDQTPGSGTKVCAALSHSILRCSTTLGFMHYCDGSVLLSSLTVYYQMFKLSRVVGGFI
jgi:hypothetical protein